MYRDGRRKHDPVVYTVVEDGPVAIGVCVLDPFLVARVAPAGSPRRAGCAGSRTLAQSAVSPWSTVTGVVARPYTTEAKMPALIRDWAG